MSARRVTAVAVAAALGASALAGCGFRGAASIPLPGGEGQGDGAYQVTIEFEDVLDLVVQSAVKVDDVTIGSVETIEVDDYTARVVVSVNPEVELPANATASIRQTSLLGEKFVSLEGPPASEARGELGDGDFIGLDRTTRSAEIEEVLSALSLVLNGGSLEQLQVINREVVATLEGREDRIKSVLGELESFVGGLDQQKGQIVRALDSLDRLSARLVTERQTLATALEEIPAGVEVLTAQREDLTEMLVALDELGDVAVRVIEQSKDNTVADLRALTPILANLNEAGEAFPRALELLSTYPFPRTVTDGIKGDYANLFVTLDLDLEQIARAEGIPIPPGPGDSAEPAAPGQAPTAPGAPAAPLPDPSDLGPLLPAPPGDVPLLDRRSTGLLRLLIGGLA